MTNLEFFDFLSPFKLSTPSSQRKIKPNENLKMNFLFGSIFLTTLLLLIVIKRWEKADIDFFAEYQLQIAVDRKRG